MHKTLLTILFLLSVLLTSAQDMNYVKSIIKTLSSEKYKGRGYVGKGDSIAANRLALEFKNIKLKKIGSSYFQTYSFPINTFPYHPLFKMGNEKMEVCKDYLISASSPSCRGTYQLAHLTSNIVKDGKKLKVFLKKDFSNSFIVFDSTGIKNNELYHFVCNLVEQNIFNAKGIVKISRSLRFSARTFVDAYPTIIITKKIYERSVKTISIDIQNKFVKQHFTNNIISYIPGRQDSTIVFSAHYDHLGYLGLKRFPGAFDNASGVSMVLELAKYFKKYRPRPKYNIMFLLFSGEEAGLQGSKYYVENPVLPLDKIMMLFNLDMVSSGVNGVGVFGMYDYFKENKLFNEINTKNKYIKDLRCTKAFASSDQYSFYKKGVKAVHVYSHGEEDFYHSPDDKLETLSFKEFENIFKLLRDYTLQKMK